MSDTKLQVGRLGLCQCCGERQAKYRCPACTLSTCSLECSQQHKIDSGCTGKRDRSGFVGLKEFDDRSLLSDYRFLEEINETSEAVKRMKPSTTNQTKSLHNDFPHLRKLRYWAGRNQITLYHQAEGMTRRRTNTTYFKKKSNRIFWRIEWIFKAADSTNLVTVTFDETKTLNMALLQVLAPVQEQAALAHKMRQYCRVETKALRLFLRVEGRQANEPAYYELRQEGTLVDQLAGRSLQTLMLHVLHT
ncbi:hypothetical protein CYMTET_50377 [Cymbomonas tetramitiformis]|uniref:HIT-type domain-containing protein n=1 Tax=Cymbomonas tetramitiformis TaxID=36881 RepID=A0AAE0BNA9_9CHLO|nr:hypothetical protein CYMTET_50377 [Cymbomonas tetramitiformis]